MRQTTTRMESPKPKLKSTLPVLRPNAAGIDVGDTQYDVAILDGQGGYLTQQFGTFTQDLHDLVAYLSENGIDTVAIESTGIYWVNLYLLLEQSGIEPYLVNAAHAKNVTGRKKDDTDAIWLQKLHSCGLLNKSFQPDGQIRVLRDYVRHRKNLVTTAADSVRRMQKALELMNIKLHTVISDILGKTGMAMVDAILSGERSFEQLRHYKDHRIKASDEELAKSLEGIWRDEYLFQLQQARQAYLFHQSQIEACDLKIRECLLDRLSQVRDGDLSSFATEKKSPRKMNTDMRSGDYSPKS